MNEWLRKSTVFITILPLHLSIVFIYLLKKTYLFSPHDGSRNTLQYLFSLLSTASTTVSYSRKF